MKVKRGDTVAIACTVVEAECGVYPNMHLVMPITDDDTTFMACESAMMGYVSFTRDNGHFMTNRAPVRKHRIVEIGVARSMVPQELMDEADKALSVATEAILVGTMNKGGFVPGELTQNQTLLIIEGDHILDNHKLMSWLSVGRVFYHKVQLNMAIEINAKLILIVKPREEYSLTVHKIFDIVKWAPPAEEA